MKKLIIVYECFESVAGLAPTLINTVTAKENIPVSQVTKIALTEKNYERRVKSVSNLVTIYTVQRYRKLDELYYVIFFFQFDRTSKLWTLHGVTQILTAATTKKYLEMPDFREEATVAGDWVDSDPAKNQELVLADEEEEDETVEVSEDEDTDAEESEEISDDGLFEFPSDDDDDDDKKEKEGDQENGQRVPEILVIEDSDDEKG